MSAPWWTSDAPLPLVRISLLGWGLVILRAASLIVLVFGSLALLILLRMVERPIYGMQRPFTPYLTVAVCWLSMRIIGLKHVVHGAPMQGAGAIVANHASWLDVFVLNATKRIYFVAKSEVARWPGIGWLARATGTVFVERNRARARAQTELFQARLAAGHKLLFFPEGTSTDGQQVLPFKSTLFQAFFAPELRDGLQIQPVTISYVAPEGADARYYGWWGDMTFGGSLPVLLSPIRHGRVEVTYHPPLRVSDYDSRKALAADAEQAVRAAHLTSRSTG
ncbi:lysophospholipid acyltransferase family protein [Sulfitobacter sp. JB4-11]|uniref:lysophospholipid acyltransferase family protein n=1 Tax=Sulfitobacter rhodophyticola TaxID=3238304 RepID=UPI0035160832